MPSKDRFARVLKAHDVIALAIERAQKPLNCLSGGRLAVAVDRRGVHPPAPTLEHELQLLAVGLLDVVHGRRDPDRCRSELVRRAECQAETSGKADAVVLAKRV